jgi:RNA polymerase sigma factor for flagellar operon FliA
MRPEASQETVCMPTVEQDDHNEFLHSQLLELADKLDERERAVVHLHYVECLDLAEVGRRLKLSRQRIHQIHKSILATLRRKLEARGITSSQ